MQPRQPVLPKLPKGVAYTLAVVCAVGISLAVYTTFNHPLTLWRKDVSRRAEVVRTKLAGGTDLRRKHSDQQRQLDELLASVEEVNSRLPDEPREGEFLADLTKLAESNDVQVIDFRRGSTTVAPTHSVVSVVVTARGSHDGLCELIDAVSKMPRLAELTHLEVRGANANDDYPIQMTYALYYGMVTTAADKDDAA